MSDKRVPLLVFTLFLAFTIILGSSIMFFDMAYAAGKIGIIKGTAVNVRSGPGTNYSKVAKANTGLKVEILDQKNGWYKVKLTNGGIGWVSKSYLQINQNNNTTTPSRGGQVGSKIIVIKGSNVNVRKGPGTSYGVIAKVNNNQSFQVLKTSNGWYYITVSKGKSGWVSSQFAGLKSTTTTTPPKTTPKPSTGSQSNTGSSTTGKTTAKYVVVKGSVVNVRSGAGTGFSVIAKVKAGAQFTLVKQQGQWYLIILQNGKQGWISSQYAEARSANTPSRENTGASTQTGSNTANSGSTETSANIIKLTGIEMNPGENGVQLLSIKASGQFKYTFSSLNSPNRLVIDIANCDLNNLSDINPDNSLIKQVRVAQYSLAPLAVRIVVNLNQTFSYVPSFDSANNALTVKFSEASIKGKIIAIDAGHGGYDPGAAGVSGLQEKDFNLKVATLLKNKLTALGATVIMTRPDDNFISLTERCRIANDAQADLFVAIHANSSTSSATKGTSTYYYAPASNSTLYAEYEQRKRLATVVQAHLINLLGTRNIGILQANFAVLRGTEMPSILVESAFLSNAAEEALLKSAQFQEKEAQAIADGLAQYFSAN